MTTSRASLVESIVYHLINTASPTPGLVERHQGTSGPKSTAETSAKASAAKHMARIDSFDTIANMRANGFKVAVVPELARFGRSMTVYCSTSLEMTQGISVMSNATLASAIEDGRFDFASFGRIMKDHCLNHKDPATSYSVKADMYYVSAKILASAVDDERFGAEMMLLCLTSPTDDIPIELEE